MIFSIAFFPFKMIPRLTRYLVRRIKKSFLQARHIHYVSLKRKEGWLRLIIALALAGFIAWQLLRTELKTGIMFCLSSALAIYSGMIYKSRVAIFLVLIGAILGALAFTLVPYLNRYVDSGDWIGVGVVLLVMLSMWLWSRWLKRAKVPDEWENEQKPNKTPKQTPAKTPGKTTRSTTAKTNKSRPRSA